MEIDEKIDTNVEFRDPSIVGENYNIQEGRSQHSITQQKLLLQRKPLVLVGVSVSSSTLLSLTRTFFLLACPVGVGVPSIPPFSSSPTGVPPLARGLDLPLASGPAAVTGGGGGTCSMASSDAEAPEASRDSERV